MISWRQNAGYHGVNKTSGIEPFAPFHITAVAVDEIAGVQHEIHPGHRRVRSPDNARPHTFNIGLRIAKINERQSISFRHFDLMPLAPSVTLTDPIYIFIARFQPFDLS